MTHIDRFENLECWQEARKFAKLVYDVTGEARFSQDPRLAAQVQGTAAACMAAIAQGFIRRSDRDFMQFLSEALSAVAEVQSHLHIALDREYLSRDAFAGLYRQADATLRSISGQLVRLRARRPAPAPEERGRYQPREGADRPRPQGGPGRYPPREGAGRPRPPEGPSRYRREEGPGRPRPQGRPEDRPRGPGGFTKKHDYGPGDLHAPGWTPRPARRRAPSEAELAERNDKPDKSGDE